MMQKPSNGVMEKKAEHDGKEKDAKISAPKTDAQVDPKGPQPKSEYRQVYLKRQSRQGGGNTPVQGEKHDQKKA